MKIIANQGLTLTGRSGYDSPVIKAVEFDVHEGFCTSGQTEKWESKSFTWDE